MAALPCCSFYLCALVTQKGGLLKKHYIVHRTSLPSTCCFLCLTYLPVHAATSELCPRAGHSSHVPFFEVLVIPCNPKRCTSPPLPISLCCSLPPISTSTLCFGFELLVCMSFLTNLASRGLCF